MSESTDFQLGQIREQLRGIEKRLDDGSGRHKDLDGRLDRLELAEAKRAGVIATIGAVAGIAGSVVVSFVTKKF